MHHFDLPDVRQRIRREEAAPIIGVLHTCSGFVIEEAVSHAEGVTMSWGEQIPPAKVAVGHLHPNKRIRLGAVMGGDHWFKYDDKGTSATRFADTAREVLPYLSGEASDHWAKGPLPDTKTS